MTTINERFNQYTPSGSAALPRFWLLMAFKMSSTVNEGVSATVSADVFPVSTSILTSILYANLLAQTISEISREY